MTATGGTGSRATRWTPTQYARNGTVDIAYDTLAGAEGEPLLLIMGLAVSRFWWPAGLGQEFAAGGSPWPATTSATRVSRAGCPTPGAATRSPPSPASGVPTPPRT